MTPTTIITSRIVNSDIIVFFNSKTQRYYSSSPNLLHKSVKRLHYSHVKGHVTLFIKFTFLINTF